MGNGAIEYETADISSNADPLTRFLYNTIPGRILLNLFVRACVSKFAGMILNGAVSKIMIKRFIRKNNIDIGEYKKVRYGSFNNFFIREIKDGYRPISAKARDLVAPCDGKLTAYKITEDGVFHIKNSIYGITELLSDNKLADEFTGGHCLIFRLTPDDYHRYCFIDSGEIMYHKRIKGVFHTVRPIAFRHYKVFVQNAREYTVMRTDNFGKVVQVEVGAMFVGKISNSKKAGAFARGEEKGYFEFGGSTVIMLFKKGAVSLDEAIFRNTAANRETIVKQGCKIGTAKKPAE